ncbi:MAG: DUF1684 domain-containing protein [Micromonosporaceae bacterium]
MSMSLLGWRRTVAAVYRRVRAEPDPERAWWIWRDARDKLFASHPDSPIPGPDRGRFPGLRYASYDPALRYELPVGDAEPTRIEVPTATDGVVPFVRVGTLRIPELGSLDVWWLDSYGGGIFVPVRDPNPETYGGGRYLVDTVKGADLGSGAGTVGSLTIDLNFAYNPSCAYDSRWVCPLAPPGNVLTTAVNAGELAYVPG